MEDNKFLNSPGFATVVEKYSHFLVEVKRRIIFTLIIFILATVSGFFFYESIIRFLISLLSLGKTNIVFTSPFQFINLAISCGVATGVIVIIPILIFQILFFLKPALKRKEFKWVLRALPFSILLFLIGFIFGAMIMKWQIEIFLDKSTSLGIGNVLDISSLLSMILLTSVLMGIGFQFPIILLTLLRLGVITHQQLSRKRQWVYLGSFIFAIFLPPDSIIADVVLSMPFVLSFEITLLVNRIMERRKKS